MKHILYTVGNETKSQRQKNIYHWLFSWLQNVRKGVTVVDVYNTSAFSTIILHSIKRK